jgi:hypothetical protein
MNQHSLQPLPQLLAGDSTQSLATVLNPAQALKVGLNEVRQDAPKTQLLATQPRLADLTLQPTSPAPTQQPISSLPDKGESGSTKGMTLQERRMWK